MKIRNPKNKRGIETSHQMMAEAFNSSQPVSDENHRHPATVQKNEDYQSNLGLRQSVAELHQILEDILEQSHTNNNRDRQLNQLMAVAEHLISKANNALSHNAKALEQSIAKSLVPRREVLGVCDRMKNIRKRRVPCIEVSSKESMPDANLNGKTSSHKDS